MWKRIQWFQSTVSAFKFSMRQRSRVCLIMRYFTWQTAWNPEKERVFMLTSKELATTGNKRWFPNKSIVDVCSDKSKYWFLSLESASQSTSTILICQAIVIHLLKLLVILPAKDSPWPGSHMSYANRKLQFLPLKLTLLFLNSPLPQHTTGKEVSNHKCPRRGKERLCIKTLLHYPLSIPQNPSPKLLQEEKNRKIVIWVGGGELEAGNNLKLYNSCMSARC
jgi:hypothetical protein